jgi:SAM-dependent methyltransferase
MTPSNPNASTGTPDANSERPAPPNPDGYSYDGDFYRYIQSGSVRSASVVLPLVLRELLPVSVLDVGCGAGAWLSEYRRLGIADYTGVDGAYVQPSSLLISPEHFQGLDIAQEFDLGRRFDIVQCLEVGEHLPKASSQTFVENLARHGDRILFSAATPGQGGENHVNEQPHEFWRLLFAGRGYKPFDLFRPMIKGELAVESWYRRNIILYVADSAIPSLPPAVRGSAIPDGQAIPEMASLAYRIQAGVLSCLPTWLLSKIAQVKHNSVIAYRRLRSSRSTP